ncbi:thiamine pyrophosphate-dependent enzyme [Paludibaculum fermentans]|uniref:thiamine pyrophosphate-dependent enzyme n=1 Tax=Paludibaculum fermentans TaxID=1473598 RepID=UPI001E30840A|nr:thiamine pyrophosphate-dependent enzyme [Paludibaculum fermentans]
MALAAHDAQLTLGTGYPGTPSTEILESLHSLGGRAQWSPNEKVALEVGIGVAFGGGRALVTMKHVGLNVAADPLFTVAYTGVRGALVIVSADDPGMASSQNEQDNRRYAIAAGIPMLEPGDSQEAYNFTLLAIELSERWNIPVLLRMTTRVCHSKTIVETPGYPVPPAPPAGYVRDVPARVMIPAYARPAHHKLRAKLAQIAAWNEREGPLAVVPGSDTLGVITSGVSFQYVREALPQASVLKLGLTYPLPLELMRTFAIAHTRTLVIEEGDPYLADSARAAGIPVEANAEIFRFGELNVARVRRMEAGDLTPEPKPVPGKPPELCHGCPHRTVFTALRDLGCIVSGDIGCYSLGVLPPFLAMDTLVCMGASIGVGLGLRHTLPVEEARRVVSVIGDSTFVHSGITGLVEMVYNPPPTGHLLLILDNGTTAMTGLQEHPGTGRTLDHASTGKFVFENVIRAMGIPDVHVVDPTRDPAAFTELVKTSLDSGRLSVIIARRNCLLAAGAIKQYEKCPEGSTHEQ